MEVDYENYDKDSVKKAFAVPYTEGKSFLTVAINHQIDLDVFEYHDIRFPYLKNKSTKLFRTSHGFNELDMGLIINHGAFLICSKLVDKTKIESGQIYVTISSSGKEVTKLVPNSETEKIDFVGMEYENGEPEDKVKLSLSLDEVYEVWKVEIMSPNPMGNDSSKVVVEELKIF